MSRKRTCIETDEESDDVNYYGKPEDWHTFHNPNGHLHAESSMLPPPFSAKIKSDRHPTPTPNLLVMEFGDSTSASDTPASSPPASREPPCNTPKSYASIPGQVYARHQIPNLSPAIRSAVRNMDARNKDWWARNSKYNSAKDVPTCAYVQLVARRLGEWTNGEKYACVRCATANRACIMALEIDGKMRLVVKPPRDRA